MTWVIVVTVADPVPETRRILTKGQDMKPDWKDICAFLDETMTADGDIDERIFARLDGWKYPLDRAGMDAFTRQGQRARFSTNTDAAIDIAQRLVPGIRFNITDVDPRDWKDDGEWRVSGRARLDDDRGNIDYTTTHSVRQIAILKVTFELADLKNHIESTPKDKEEPEWR